MKLKQDQTIFFENIYRSSELFRFQTGNTPPSQPHEGRNLDEGQATNIRDIEKM